MQDSELCINFEDFKWFVPRPKSRLFITVPNQQMINFNVRLMEQIPKRVTIGVSEDGRTLCVREDEEKGYKVPSSGSLIEPEIVALLVGLGVRLPARYSVTQGDGCWIGTLEQEPLKPPKAKRGPRNIKKSEGESVIKELEARK